MKIFLLFFLSALSASTLIHYKFELSERDINALDKKIHHFSSVVYMNFLKSIFLPDLVNFFSHSFDADPDDSVKRYRRAILIKYEMLAGDMDLDKILKELETFDVRRIYFHSLAMSHPEVLCSKTEYKLGQKDYHFVEEYFNNMTTIEKAKGQLANKARVELINSLVGRARQHAFGVDDNV